MFERKKSVQPDFRRESEFLNCVFGEFLTKKFRENGAYLAGGCIRSIFTNQKINDFDLFFKDAESFESVKKVIKEHASSFKVLCETQRATTFEVKTEAYNTNLKMKRKDANPLSVYGPSFLVDENKKIQLVCLEFGEIHDTLDRFDFRCCMGAYDFKKFYFDPCFFTDNSRKILNFNPNCMLPMSSLYRMNKFLSMGYTIPDESLLLLTLTINQLKIDNYGDLKEKLKQIPLNNATKTLLTTNILHDWSKTNFNNRQLDIEEVEQWLYSDSTYEVPDYVNKRAMESFLQKTSSDSLKAKLSIV